MEEACAWRSSSFDVEEMVRPSRQYEFQKRWDAVRCLGLFIFHPASPAPLAFLHCRHFIDSAFVFVGCDPRLIPEGGDLVLEGDGNAEAYEEGRGLETGADLILI